VAFCGLHCRAYRYAGRERAFRFEMKGYQAFKDGELLVECMAGIFHGVDEKMKID
jgi:hypothetical protein